MMQYSLPSKDILSSPTTRVIGVLLAAVLLAMLDYRNGRVLLDPASAYPFLIMLIVPASLSIRLGFQSIFFIRKTCVPIGILVCTLNTVILLSNMSEIRNFLYETRLTYAPLALGILLSLLLSIVEPERKPPGKSDGSTFFLLALLTGIAVAFATFFLVQIKQIQDLGIEQYASYEAMLGSLSIYSLCLIHPKMASFSPIEKLYKSSLAIILVSAIFGVSSYVYAVAVGVASMGGAVANAILGMSYGSIMAIFSTVAGGNLRETDQESMLFDWHIIEAYAFYALIVMPPLSIIEVFTADFEPDSEEITYVSKDRLAGS